MVLDGAELILKEKCNHESLVKRFIIMARYTKIEFKKRKSVSITTYIKSTKMLNLQ